MVSLFLSYVYTCKLIQVQMILTVSDEQINQCQWLLLSSIINKHVIGIILVYIHHSFDRRLQTF